MTRLDTTFPIDLQREMESGRPGRAAQWIRDNGEEEAGISAVARGADAAFSLTQSGNNVTISYVPEPGTGSLLLVGLASWALVRAGSRRSARA